MSKIGESLLRGAKEALAYAKGETTGSITHKAKVKKEINVSEIRNHLHMSRQEFSDAFGFSLRTLEKWERGERLPDGPARAYLMVIEKNPKAVREALA